MPKFNGERRRIVAILSNIESATKIHKVVDSNTTSEANESR